MPTEAYDLQIIIASGPGDARRAILGLSMAASAAAAGKRTYVYMAMDGARCLTKDHCSVPLLTGYPTVAEFIEIVVASGGNVEYCPNCLGDECDLEVRRSVQAVPMCELTHPGGMSTLAVRFTDIPTVVF